MPEENKTESTDNAAANAGQEGSSDNLVQKQADPNLGGSEGDSAADTKPPKDTKDTGTKESDDAKSDTETVPKSQYEDLEKKLGEQGNELGEYRDYYTKISPMLDKLDEQPDLVKAIMSDKITSELVKSVLEGKVSTKEATTVTEAHEKVKEQLGKTKYEKASPEDIQKLIKEQVKEQVDEGVGKVKEEFDKKVSGVKEDAAADKFGNQLTKFIEDTSDYAEYAEGINEWFDKNPNQYDIRIAYDVVKGRALAAKISKDKEEADGEAAKDAAGNAGPGAGQATGTIKDDKLIDSLIAGRGNPNIL